MKTLASSRTMQSPEKLNQPAEEGSPFPEKDFAEIFLEREAPVQDRKNPEGPVIVESGIVEPEPRKPRAVEHAERIAALQKEINSLPKTAPDYEEQKKQLEKKRRGARLELSQTLSILNEAEDRHSASRYQAEISELAAQISEERKLLAEAQKLLATAEDFKAQKEEVNYIKTRLAEYELLMLGKRITHSKEQIAAEEGRRSKADPKKLEELEKQLELYQESRTLVEKELSSIHLDKSIIIDAEPTAAEAENAESTDLTELEGNREVPLESAKEVSLMEKIDSFTRAIEQEGDLRAHAYDLFLKDPSYFPEKQEEFAILRARGVEPAELIRDSQQFARKAAHGYAEELQSEKLAAGSPWAIARHLGSSAIRSGWNALIGRPEAARESDRHDLRTSWKAAGKFLGRLVGASSEEGVVEKMDRWAARRFEKTQREFQSGVIEARLQRVGSRIVSPEMARNLTPKSLLHEALENYFRDDVYGKIEGKPARTNLSRHQKGIADRIDAVISLNHGIFRKKAIRDIGSIRTEQLLKLHEAAYVELVDKLLRTRAGSIELRSPALTSLLESFYESLAELVKRNEVRLVPHADAERKRRSAKEGGEDTIAL